MKNLILIDDEKDYTLSEFTHLVRRALSAVANESPDMELVYPGREVYFAIFDLLRLHQRPRDRRIPDYTDEI